MAADWLTADCVWQLTGRQLHPSPFSKELDRDLSGAPPGKTAAAAATTNRTSGYNICCCCCCCCSCCCCSCCYLLSWRLQERPTAPLIIAAPVSLHTHRVHALDDLVLRNATRGGGGKAPPAAKRTRLATITSVLLLYVAAVACCCYNRLPPWHLPTAPLIAVPVLITRTTYTIHEEAGRPHPRTGHKPRGSYCTYR